LATWAVDLIRKRDEHLGSVAGTEKEAIEKAAKEFNIPPPLRSKIAVTKLPKGKGD
jgi:hypothetical protein